MYDHHRHKKIILVKKSQSGPPQKNINVHMLEFITSTNTFNSIEKRL